MTQKKTPTKLTAWKNLAPYASQLRDKPLAQLIDDPVRAQKLVLPLAGNLFDFSKQWVDQDVIAQLLKLADEAAVLDRASDMFAGKKINLSEDRAVLHSALRNGATDVDPAILQDIGKVQTKLLTCADAVRNGHWRGYSNQPITDVVHIGIGGSNLGPEMVVQALADYATSHLNLHFVANIDANQLDQVLRNLDPARTLFVLVSKSFGTLETQVNARTARSWFLERTGDVQGLSKHFIGVTSNISAAVDFGLDADNLYPIWDWVGGRFSLWSAVGIPILFSIGSQHFANFLGGAQEVDEHFATASPEENVPLLSALLATWNYNFLGATSLAVLPYDERLKLLPNYLQQLEMESNGKSVRNNGERTDYHTMPILWGGTGTNGQHAYHQLLHQGTRAYTADFIMVATDDRHKPEHHNWLNANALAQSQAMAVGYAAGHDQPYRHVGGNHPHTVIVCDALAPRQLGGMLAVYEHKVFCQGVIWDINSFDQWGVELGKKLAEPIYATLTQGKTEARRESDTQDASTTNLLRYLLTLKDANKNEDTQ